MRSPGPDEPSGRGLQIVDMLSDSWGVEPEDPSGKTVWFTMPAAAADAAGVRGGRHAPPDRRGHAGVRRGSINRPTRRNNAQRAHLPAAARYAAGTGCPAGPAAPVCTVKDAAAADDTASTMSLAATRDPQSTLGVSAEDGHQADSVRRRQAGHVRRPPGGAGRAGGVVAGGLRARRRGGARGADRGSGRRSGRRGADGGHGRGHAAHPRARRAPHHDPHDPVGDDPARPGHDRLAPPPVQAVQRRGAQPSSSGAPPRCTSAPARSRPSARRWRPPRCPRGPASTWSSTRCSPTPTGSPTRCRRCSSATWP